MDSLLAELRELQEALGGRAVATGPGWPVGLEARLEGTEPELAYPCPYGNFAWARLTERAMERLGEHPDHRDLLTLAVLEPGLFA